MHASRRRARRAAVFGDKRPFFLFLPPVTVIITFCLCGAANTIDLVGHPSSIDGRKGNPLAALGRKMMRKRKIKIGNKIRSKIQIKRKTLGGCESYSYSFSCS
jgi:hypothetical protein